MNPSFSNYDKRIDPVSESEEYITAGIQWRGCISPGVSEFIFFIPKSSDSILIHSWMARSLMKAD